MNTAFIFLLFGTAASMEIEFGSFVWELIGKRTPIPGGFDKCKLNWTLIDGSNIEATKSVIAQCFEGLSLNCAVEKKSKYRTADGSCNNLKRPWQGKSYICQQRILPYDYGDGVGYPRKSCTGNELPNPRLVSNIFHKQQGSDRDQLTTHSMEWGQVIAHDLSLNIIYRTTIDGLDVPIDCCENGPVYNDFCASSPEPPGETWYTSFNITCLPYTRTRACPCNSGQRQHLNRNTAHHDLSIVYGNNRENASDLRSFQNGMLRVSYNDDSGGAMLPVVSVEENCVSVIPGRNSCFHTGDPRTNQTPFLMTVHTYLLRYHNLICQKLSKVNPNWNDEKLYQESRRILVAIAQYITYAKYLPNILGSQYYKGTIAVLPGAGYTKYDPDTDATILDEFPVFAQRYGHTLIPGSLREIDPQDDRKEQTIRLRDNYYNPYTYKFDEIAKGMTVDREMIHDQFLTDDVRDFLYRRTYLNEPLGDDLAAVSVIRGRDHGIPGYTYYLAYFFNYVVRSFDDLRPLMPDMSVDQLEDIYESVHDVDVYSGGLAEYHVPGGIVGPTFAVVLVEQYKRTKFGDRYWFEHGNQAGSFTPGQLLEIKRSSLTRILCETTKMKEIQKDPFRPQSPQNPLIPCKDIPKFNFFLWKE